MQAITDLQEYLNRCAGQLASLFGALMHQLESLLTTVQTSSNTGNGVGKSDLCC